MKQNRLIVSLLLLPFVLPGSAACLQTQVNARAPEDLRQQVIELERQAKEATLKRDAEFSERTLSEDYMGITPLGQVITKADTIIYRSSQSDCATCPMKTRCCPNTPTRKIARSVHESARDVARNIAKTSGYKQSRRDRKKVEMLFAHLKRILKLDRLRLRGPSGAHDEFLLAATAQNLRRMAKWLYPAEPETANV